MLRNLVVLLFAASLPSQTTVQPSPVPYEDPDAYSVYSAILKMGKPKPETWVADTTVNFNQCLPQDASREVASAVASYQEANRTHWALQRKLQLPGSYKLVPYSAQLFERSSVHDGKDQSPVEIRVYRFSAVGFNQSKTLAFVEMDFTCGGLCGQGEPLLLEKRNGQWVKYDPPPTKNSDGTFSFRATCVWVY